MTDDDPWWYTDPWLDFEPRCEPYSALNVDHDEPTPSILYGPDGEVIFQRWPVIGFARIVAG